MPDWLSILIALGGALSGLAALLALRHEARKAEALVSTAGAEVRTADVEAHTAVLQSLLADYARVNTENESLHDEVTFLRRQADAMQEKFSVLQETLDHAVRRIGGLEREGEELRVDNRALCAELGRRYNRNG